MDSVEIPFRSGWQDGRAALWVAYAVLLMGVVVAVYVHFAFPGDPDGLWLIMIVSPVAVVAAVLRSVVNDSAHLVISERGLVEKHSSFSNELQWSSITRLSLPAVYDGIPAKGFPRLLVIETARSIPPSWFNPGTRIVLFPNTLAPPETLLPLLDACLHRVVPSAIDLEVLCLYAMARYTEQAPPGLDTDEVGTLDAKDPAVASLLAGASGSGHRFAAPFHYFLGHLEKARAQCEEGLGAEPGAWDLLLCRALCERALGDAVACRRSFQAALEASPPPGVLPVLACALETA